MSRRLFAVLFCLAAPAQAAERKAASPSEAITAIVGYQAPKGWKPEAYANGGGADPVLAYVDGLDRIAVRAFGAPGSGYKNSASFLDGAAASTMGRKPETIGSVTASGRRLTLYRRGFPIGLGDPHSPSGPARLGSEVFCLLPAPEGRFIVLSYARESPVPDLERGGAKAWEAFLKTVKLTGRKT